MKNYAFVMINPWAVQWRMPIFEIMDDIDATRVITADVLHVPRKAFERQYSHKVHCPYYLAFLSSVVGKKVVSAFYVGAGEDFYGKMVLNKERAREIYNPQIPQPGTSDGLKYVALHCSGNSEEAEREFNGWRGHFEKVEGINITDILRMNGVEVS